MFTLALAGNARMNVASSIVDTLLRKQFLQNHLILNFNDKKQDVLTWRNTMLGQTKSYIDNNLNPAKINVIDPTEDSFTQPLSIK